MLHVGLDLSRTRLDVHAMDEAGSPVDARPQIPLRPVRGQGTRVRIGAAQIRCCAADSSERCLRPAASICR